MDGGTLLLGGSVRGGLTGAPKTIPAGRRGRNGTARSVADAQVDDAELAVAIWQLLYGDPLFELRWIASTAISNGTHDDFLAPPGAHSPGRMVRRQLGRLDRSSGEGELDALLRAYHLRSAWDEAFSIIRDSQELDDAMATDHAELPNAVARALAAAVLVTANEVGVPSVTAETRDKMVGMLLNELGGQSRGITRWLLAPLKGLTVRGVTWYVARDRAGLSEEAAPAAGDVLLYQTRGEEIRRYIADRIVEAGEPVYLLAHSLGGIACVDLIIMNRPANVRGLITVGSQSPLLYELDCLTSLRPPAGLPEGFPRWLNIYDPRDFLSYMAQPVFDPLITRDIEVRSGQPFPQSHSAYWQQEAVWRNVVDFIDAVERDHRSSRT